MWFVFALVFFSCNITGETVDRATYTSFHNQITFTWSLNVRVKKLALKLDFIYLLLSHHVWRKIQVFFPD